ncbi:MAG: NF038122 family metalloprotease [Acidobacteria bacterium]|nr:NF038122 family metalloprotease [Acidobacteriota bacterium]
MFRSPLRAVRSSRAGKRHSRFSTRLGSSLALLLALMLGLFSPLSTGVFAQADGADAPAKGNAYVAANRTTFVISQAEDGETACHEATPEEARIYNHESGVGLHRINHLEQESNSALAPEASGSNALNSSTGLTIVLRATTQLEQNAEAKAAFIRAAATWESIITSPITIIIDVDFGTTHFGTPFSSSNVLGATNTQLLFFANNYPSIRSRLIGRASNAEETALYNNLPATTIPTDLGDVPTVVVPSPILRALGSIAPVANPDTETNFGPVPQIGFNSAFGFDFDPSNGITSTQTDFDAVAVHEIGHALGFDSEVGVHELNPSGAIHAGMWDLFRFRPSTATVGTFATAQRILSSGGEQNYFDGGTEQRLSTGKPDGTGGDLEQASHWKDDRLNGFVFIGIMDPSIPRGRRFTITANDRRAIDFMGFSSAPPPAAPANDNFASAQAIAGSSGTTSGTNIGATKEVGEPNHAANPGGRSVWYRWTAPASGTATFDTKGSNYDTTLAVYTGGSVGALALIVENDDIVSGTDIVSTVTFNAIAGTTYQIAVDGFDADSGSIILNWNSATGPAPPNTVQFSAASTTVNENGVSVAINVTRTGTTTSAATVNYATGNGTASDRSDYLAAVGTLRFAANETSKTFNVFVVDDAFLENPETFSVTLSNPVDCTLGAPATETVTINSNDTATGPNPVKDGSFDANFFVRQHYIDFLNREADAPGLSFWTNQITSCGSDQACLETRKINVSAAFFLSTEFQQTGFLVYQLHQAAFNTQERLALRTFLADTQEIGRGVVIGAPGADALLEANKVAFINGFVTRPQFTALYPLTMTAAQFVDALNANTGGSLSPAERDSLVASGQTRAQILRTIAENGVFRQRQSNKAFVLMQYFGYMRRNPNDAPEPTLDFAGYNFWLGKLNQFNGNFINAEMVKAFITSGEYQGRFGL